eukprot:SAG11_NODE_5740_length_1474_cov_1.141091_2_plen_41_part_01
MAFGAQGVIQFPRTIGYAVVFEGYTELCAPPPPSSPSLPPS